MSRKQSLRKTSSMSSIDEKENTLKSSENKRKRKETPKKEKSKRSSKGEASKIKKKKLKGETEKEQHLSKEPVKESVVEEKSNNSATTEDLEPEVLERGTIYYFYQPKLSVKEEVHGIDEVQKLYLVLSPHDHNKLKRLIIIGNKKMPSTHTHSRYWGFVDNVSPTLPSLIKDNLGERDYETPVLHEPRHLKEARLFASGLYAIVLHHSHTHLAYFLELPEELSEVQKAFNIEKQGSLLMSIKNPEVGESMLKGQKPELPPELKDHFGNKKWGPIDHDVKLLDIKKIEIFILGDSPDPVKEFGKVGEELEEIEKEEVKKLHPHNKIFEKLKMDKANHKIEPILTGQWE